MKNGVFVAYSNHYPPISPSLFSLRVLLSLAVLAVAGVANSQTAHLVHGVTLVTGGQQGYLGVDANGNLYTVSNSAIGLKQSIRQLPYSETPIGSGLSDARGVVVDNSGNVYIADFGNNRVVKVPLTASGYGTQTTVGTGLNAPRGIAVDMSGNVYIADSANRVLKETLSGGTYAQSTIGSGFSATYGLAVDNSGNVYIVDAGSSTVYKETPSGSNYTQTTVGTGLSDPLAVAVDQSGNLYIADFGNNRILMETLNAGAYTQSVVLTSVTTPTIAVDGNGNIFASDISGNPSLSIQPGGVDFFRTSTGSSSLKGTLTFSFDGAGSVGGSSVFTKGEAGQDFADAGTGTCTTNGSSKLYSAGDTCTVDVVFSPKYTGNRVGATVLTDASGKRIATAYLYGQGVGPQITFLPDKVTTLLTRTSPILSLDVDDSGNLYLADTGNHQILEEKPTGSSYAETGVDSGLFNSFSVAVDGGGSVYFPDPGTNQVFKETPSGSGFIQTVVPVMNAYRGTAYVAVDPSGNVYVSLSNGGSIVKETLSGETYTESAVATIGNIAAMSVDSVGNVYLTDQDTGSVVKETLSAGGYTQSTVALAATTSAVAVDDTGSVYIADQNKGILKESPTATGYAESVLLSKPQGDFFTAVALDGQGNLYIASATGLVEKIDLADPPSLSFASTAVGATSSDSPQAVTVSNIGTAPLTFPVSATGNNPSISSGFVLGSSGSGACALLTPTSTTPGTLAASSACSIAVSFSPIAVGLDTGSIQLTDDSLNGVPNPTQTIPLTGTGTGVGAPQAVLSPTSLSFGDVTTGSTSASQSITLSNPGTSALTLTGLSVTGTNTTKFAQTNTCGTSLAAGASCVITVTFSPDVAGGYSASISIADNASGSPQIASLTGTGVAPAAPQAVLSPTSLAFGNTIKGTTSATQGITLSNPGTAALTIAGITVIGSNATKFAQTNNCGGSLAAGSACTITVSFSPDVVGAYSASISVADNASGSPQTAALTGTGVAPASPQAVLSPTSLSFPNTTVGSSASALVAQLSNPGNASLAITGITIAGTSASAFTLTTTCGTSLAAGATCSISVVFTPSSSTTYAAFVSVADNASGSPHTAQLSGSGVAALVPDFSITATNSPQTIARGASGQYTIALAPANGSFPSAINLSISGLPTGVTGTFSPASVTPNGNAASSTLTVAVSNSFAATSSSPFRRFDRSRVGEGGAAIAFAVLLMPWFKRKRIRPLALQVLLAVMLVGGIIV